MSFRLTNDYTFMIIDDDKVQYKSLYIVYISLRTDETRPRGRPFHKISCQK